MAKGARLRLAQLVRVDPADIMYYIYIVSLYNQDKKTGGQNEWYSRSRSPPRIHEEQVNI
jgi:hypothetical protein